MVQIKEMVEVLRVVKDIPTLKQGMYVRMKRTMFKDDLAQVWLRFSFLRVPECLWFHGYYFCVAILEFCSN